MKKREQSVYYFSVPERRCIYSFYTYLEPTYITSMAFRPGSNQKFYLAAKQKGKVLGITQNTLGCKLQLLDYKGKDFKQIFRFDSGCAFYWIKFPEYDRYLTVHGALQDNNVPIVSWQWEPDRQHLMFEFVPASDGYYRIRARHSGKYLEVVENKDTHTSDLVQNEWKNNNNQLFFPVLLPEEEEEGFPRPPVFYQEETDLRRTIYLALIGQIPDVGEGLSFIVGYFWKEKDKLGDFWEMMKNYVDIRIRQLILEKEIEFLKEEFVGYLNLLAEIRLSLLPKKGARIQGVLDSMIKNMPHFTDKSVEVLPLLIGFGTTLIVLRKIIYDNWDELFDTKETAAIKLNNLLFLQSSVDQLTEAVEKSKAKYMEWRMAKISDAQTIFPSGIEQSIMKDDYEGMTHSWLGPGKREGTPDHLERAKFAVEQRKSIASTQFTAALEELTKAARFWKYFNPLVPFTSVKAQKTIGIFGGKVYKATSFSMSETSTFDRIDFFTKNGSLCGLELFFKNVSYGLMGSRSNEQHTCTLETGEYINSVYGYAKDQITSLWMTTNKGKKTGAGNYGESPYYFTADLPDSFQARLHGISGAYNEMLKDNLVMQLSFRWEYDDL